MESTGDGCSTWRLFPCCVGIWCAEMAVSDGQGVGYGGRLDCEEGDAAAQMQWVLELIGIGLKSGGDLGQCCAVVYAPGWARFRDPVPGDEGPVLWRGLP
jgi:hypothetical protein